MVVAALKHPNGAKWSDGKIGEHVGVDDKTVAKYRKLLRAAPEIPDLPIREGLDGKVYNTANIGETDETKIKRLAAKGLSVREIAESVGWSKSRVARFLRTTESASGTKTGSRGTDDEQDEPETPTPARTADDSKSFGVTQSAKTLRSWSDPRQRHEKKPPKATSKLVRKNLPHQTKAELATRSARPSA